jgi:lantibiotic modifying enzyme
LPGLYVGEGSTGVALLRAGQVLGDFSLIEAAAERSHAISTIPFASPDLFNGTAGRIRFHLWVYEETKDVAHLQYAIRAGEWLLETAQHLSADEVSWVMPEGYGTLSGPVALSYAHGASGIADSLLDLFDVTNDHRFRDIAAGTARWVARQAHPILADGSGFAWPDMEGGSPMTGFWCHGASGIGQFFLHVAQLDLLPRAWELAAGAARTTGQTVRFGGPTHCHGLAGSIEFLLDMYQATGNREYLGESRSLARLLEGFSRVHEGNLEYCNDFTDSFSPDYLLGYAGIAVTMLRLALPEDVPHQLSRSGFRYRG